MFLNLLQICIYFAVSWKSAVAAVYVRLVFVTVIRKGISSDLFLALQGEQINNRHQIQLTMAYLTLPVLCSVTINNIWMI